MPPAARFFATTPKPGTVTAQRKPTVLIGGLPAAVVGDLHVCAMPPLAGPHPPTTIVMGSLTVLIDGMPAARLGDLVACGAPIVTGVPNVMIGG